MAPRIRRAGWLALLLAAGLPAQAGSITASSIWDRQNALERARQQLPAGAVITAERCQEVEVGTGNIHYRCTVIFSDPPPAGSSAPAP